MSMFTFKSPAKTIFPYLLIALERVRFISSKNNFLSMLSGLYAKIINHFGFYKVNSKAIVSAFRVSKLVNLLQIKHSFIKTSFPPPK